MPAVSQIRKTKIIATMGPAVASLEGVTELIVAGMDVARLNFSHGTRDTKRQTIRDLRAAASERGRPIAILQDLAGPKEGLVAVEVDESLGFQLSRNRTVRVRVLTKQAGK